MLRPKSRDVFGLPETYEPLDYRSNIMKRCFPKTIGDRATGVRRLFESVDQRAATGPTLVLASITQHLQARRNSSRWKHGFDDEHHLDDHRGGDSLVLVYLDFYAALVIHNWLILHMAEQIGHQDDTAGGQ